MSDVTFSLFDGVPVVELSPFLQRFEHRTYPAGATVLVQGDQPREMFLIQHGSADVLVADAAGTEARVARLGPGETAGEISIFTGQPTTATVRAGPDATLDVIALGPEDFTALVDAFPVMYRNLGRVLAQRLRRANHRLAQHQRGRVFLLPDYGSSPLLGYALACGIAWHTRAPVLYLILGEGEAPAEIARWGEDVSQATHLGHILKRNDRYGREGRAWLAFARPDGLFRRENLPAVAEELALSFAYVLLQTPGPMRVEGAEPRQVYLVPGGHGMPGMPDTARQGGGLCLTMSDTKGRLPRPGQNGTVHVPVFTDADRASLSAGLLPPHSPAGKAIGWAARDVANLKVGVALGAGGPRGHALLGVLKVLDAVGIPVDYISGASIGGVVGSLYALHESAEHTSDIMDEAGRNAVRWHVPSNSLLSSRGILKLVQRQARDLRFEDLDIPLSIIACDVVRQQEVILHEGLLWPAIMATLCIPVAYPLVRIGERLLCDGGVIDPVPAGVAKSMGADVVVAVKLYDPIGERDSSVVPLDAKFGGHSPLSTLFSSIEVMQRKIASDTIMPSSTVVIEPAFGGLSVYDVRHMAAGRRYIAAGEEAAHAVLPQLRELLPWLCE